MHEKRPFVSTALVLHRGVVVQDNSACWRRCTQTSRAELLKVLMSMMQSFPPDNLLVRNFMNNFCDTFCWWWIAWHKFCLNIISTCEHLQMFVRFRSNIGKVFFSFFDNFHYQFFCFSIVSSIVGTFPICLVKLYENASLSRWLKTFWENRIFARGVQICEFKITLLLMGSSPSCVALPVRWRLFVKTLQRPLCVSSYVLQKN